LLDPDGVIVVPVVVEEGDPRYSGVVTLFVKFGAVELSDVPHAEPVETAIPAPG
jgi:hypothetical protein